MARARQVQTPGFNPMHSPMARAFESTDESVAIKPRNPQSLSVLDFAMIFHKVYHNKEYEISRTGFHEMLAETLDNVISGRWKRVIISAPPQHGKSQLVKYAAGLALARNPAVRIIYGSYGQTLSDEASLEIREIVYSEQFQKMFNVKPHKSVGAINNWKVDQNGGLRATGVGGGLTGRSGDLVFVDDPHKDRAEANSETFRERVKGWWKSTLTTRFQGDATSVCIIQTRWHEDDLSGWLQTLEEELPPELREGWIIVNLPALAEEDDILGREVGESLYPEKYSREYLLRKQAADPLEFEALFQGKPTLAAGDIFKLEDFVEYNTYDDVPGGMVYLSLDTAMKDKEVNDLSAWVKAIIDKDKNIWVLDFGWGKYTSPKLRALTERIYLGQETQSPDFQPDLVVIEDKASGIGLIQEFAVSNPHGVPVRAYNPGRDDKILRSTLLQGKVAAHQVYVPKHHPRLAAFLAFFTAFPNGRYMDPVDAFSQLANFALQQKPSHRTKKGSSSYVRKSAMRAGRD